ncbi:iron-containing redox enzyme family protein [Singulisphaera sp. Ch08]|uniref:Iron-containing redox enzyme family protein n=1 Tax=Singulisphaera sp. Ch08 TaxID=3120278 RepID=A0AAU7CP23_9BACT
MAAAHCSLDVDRRLHLACMEHAQDEKNHEQLALNDLEQLGYSLDAFPELPDTAQLYQSQYYLIEHVNPAALYGSILYLEGLASTIGPEVLQRVTNSHGQAAVAFLYEHVSLDKEHIKKALDVASQCRPEQLSSIIWSLRQKKTIYLHILESISQTSLTRERS